jgi:hypothetical protein
MFHKNVLCIFINNLYTKFNMSISNGSLLSLRDITHWRSWALLEKLPIVQLLKNFQHFMEPVGLLPCSQEPSTGPYPEPDRSNPYYPILSV